MKKTSILILSISFIMFLFSCGNTENNANNNTGEENTNVEETNNTSEEDNVVKEQVKVTSNNQTTDNEAFDYLEKLNVGNGSEVFIKYNPASTTVINKTLSELDKNDPLFINDDMSMDDIKLVKTKISSNGDSYNVVFSWGASADPEFLFYKDGTDTPIFSVAALNLYIPGNGNIYTAGHTNNYFNIRKKFTFKNNKFVEAEQAFYYVGLQSKTLKAITLYKSESLRTSIANLPADYNVEVLINKQGTNLYLIKTDFGLTGWTKLPMEYGNPTIEGLFYAGD